MARLDSVLAPKSLQTLAEASVEHTLIRPQLTKAGLTKPDIVRAILREKNLKQAISLAISEIAAKADQLESEIWLNRGQVYARNEEMQGYSPALVLLCFLLVVAVLSAVVVVTGHFVGGLPIATLIVDWRYVGPVAAIAVLAASIRAAGYVRWPVVSGRRKRKEAAAKRADLEGQVETASNQLRSYDDEIASTVRDRLLVSAGLGVLEREISPSYALELPEGTAAPLGEVFDPWFDTHTNAREQMEQLFSAMSGGSIGISGPRGAGKSTLINYFCRRSDRDWQPRGLPVLAFATPAPARYEARDFVLHLFATLCHTVLAVKGGQQRASTRTTPSSSPRIHPLLSALLPYRQMILMLGAAIITIGACLLALRATTILWPTTALNQLIDVLAQLKRTLGLNLGIFMAAGFALWFMARILNRIVFNIQRRHSERDSSESPDLSSEARKHLEVIQFQRSFTAGWSGTLTLPIGVAATANEAQTFAERQASLPEIIDRYSAFVHRVTRDYTVIIGIDELDKLKSDEEAEKFLNDNKVLFGLEGCFYLVSISESALASFERRGLPMRDVFDSSFDEVVHVGYLDANQAIRLLRRRVAQLPLPFACLCHVLAGGLPRDLIRSCRSLYLLASQSPERTLHALTASLVVDDLRRKCRAIIHSAKRLDTNYTSNFLVAVNRIQAQQPTAAFLDDQATLFVSAPPMLADKASEEERRLAGLCFEFGNYLYFCATLLSYYDDRLDEVAFRRALQEGAFDALAEARQSLSIDPKLAGELCAEFRQNMRLTDLSISPQTALNADAIAVRLPTAEKSDAETTS